MILFYLMTDQRFLITFLLDKKNKKKHINIFYTNYVQNKEIKLS